MNKRAKAHYLVVRIDNDFKQKYIEYCNDNGYTLSKRVLAIMKRDMENNKCLQQN